MVCFYQHIKFIVFTILFFGCSILFAQQDSNNQLSPHTQWFNSPVNISDSTEYDGNTETIFITNYVGGHRLSVPTYFSREEYKNYLFNQKFNNYWKQRISGSTSNSDLGKVGLGSKIINRVFGGAEVDIKPQGSAELIFSGVINKIDNPALPEEQRKTTSFNFDERIQMNVIGRIGNKLQLQANYDTEATFEFENEIKLE